MSAVLDGPVDDRDVRDARGSGDFFEQINQIRHNVGRLNDGDVDRRDRCQRPAPENSGMNYLIFPLSFPDFII